MIYIYIQQLESIIIQSAQFVREDREFLHIALGQAVQKHPNTSVFVNFASFRSVHETTMEAEKKWLCIAYFYRL